jgi:site-specific recombinase XerD
MLHSQYIVDGTRKSMVAQFRSLCKGVGIPHSFHAFRHAFVTRLVNAGVDPLIIGSMTGQSREQIQAYAHVSNEAKCSALAKARAALHATRLHELQTTVIPSAA